MRYPFLPVLLLIGLPVAAQPVLGVKGGPSMANINGAPSFINARLGFHAGVFVTNELSKRFSLQAEVLYSQKGFRSVALIETTQGSKHTARFQFNLTHLDVPVVVKCRVFNRFSPYVGPQASLLVGRNASVKGLQIDNVTFSSRGRLQVGIVAGLGYRITNRLGADVRYCRDLYGSGFYSHAFQAGMHFVLLSQKVK